MRRFRPGKKVSFDIIICHHTCRGSRSLLFCLVESHVCLFCCFCGCGGCQGCPEGDTSHSLQILFKKFAEKMITQVVFGHEKRHVRSAAAGFAFNSRRIKQDESSATSILYNAQQVPSLKCITLLSARLLYIRV